LFFSLVFLTVRVSVVSEISYSYEPADPTRKEYVTGDTFANKRLFIFQVICDCDILFLKIKSGLKNQREEEKRWR
jgi:hypothetical protein